MVSRGLPAPTLREARRERALGAMALLALLLAALSAGSASAANLFTIDAQADSFGPVVTDTTGNGYVTWLHTAMPDDTTVFCKLPPGSTRCAHPITLALPPGDATSGTPGQPFAVLAGIGAPPGTVFVVENRYVANDTVIWRSTDGGQTFSGPDDIGVGCYSNTTDVDDVLWWNGYAGFVTASHNPGLGYAFSVFGETCAGAEATPDTGAGQGATGWQFANPGSGGVGSASVGFASSTEPKSDQIEAYWLANSPPALQFMRHHERGAPPGSTEDLSSTLPSNWSGPIRIGNGYEPRLAQGAAGLFLFSADNTAAGATPSAIDIRRYAPAQLNFTAPLTLQSFPQSQIGLFDGGALGENGETGELVAAWPYEPPGGGGSLMRLYLSTNGGTSFSPGEAIARIGGGYAVNDNARLAAAPNGSGFLTFRDSSGLRVADLNPAPAQFAQLSANGAGALVPVLCPAPHGHCSVRISITLGAHSATASGPVSAASRALLGSSRFTVSAGATRRLRVQLSGALRRALRSHHGRVRATLSLSLRAAGLAHTTTAAVKLHG
jgi:hypothetical protein